MGYADDVVEGLQEMEWDGWVGPARPGGSWRAGSWIQVRNGGREVDTPGKSLVIASGGGTKGGSIIKCGMLRDREEEGIEMSNVLGGGEGNT